MTKIITDNSKVNINLLEENELLKKQVEKLKLDKQELQKQLTLTDVGCSLPNDELIDAMASIEAIKYYFANDYNYSKARAIFIAGVNWYKKHLPK